MSWVDVSNWGSLMQGYQKSSYDSTWMPGIGNYLEQIIAQNEKIIEILKNERPPANKPENT